MSIETKPLYAPIGALKNRLRRYPQYGAVRSAYRSLARNVLLLRHVAREGLWARLFLPASRGTASQQILTWTAAIPELREARALSLWFREQGVTVKEGHNTIYLAPGPRLTEILGSYLDTYPRHCGFKILKQLGPPTETQYLVPQSQMRARSRLIGSPLDQLVTANYLHALGLGPRVWDVTCWRAGQDVYTVFVVDHVSGDTPTAGQSRHFLAQLTDAVASTPLRIVLPNWRQSIDFSSADCNQNLLVSTDGRLQYIDFQNFCMSSPAAWMSKVLASAPGIFHFGKGRLFRGAQYLYQSVPGSPTSAKRNTAARWSRLTSMLRASGIDMSGRLVLDVGCNSGIMLHGALASGARWGLGWDRPSVARHAEELLLSLGTTRVHLYGADLGPHYRLENDIPSRFRSELGEAVVLYLSVREHIGLLDSLTRVPWRALVYEGHQEEDLGGLPRILAPLLRDGVRCVSSALMSDGDCLPRPVALLVRDR